MGEIGEAKVPSVTEVILAPSLNYLSIACSIKEDLWMRGVGGPTFSIFNFTTSFRNRGLERKDPFLDLGLGSI